MSTNITTHLITGGKGGVGKTILTILLIRFILDNIEDKDDCPLLIDLNTNNTDSSYFLEKLNTIEPKKIYGKSETYYVKSIEFNNKKRQKKIIVVTRENTYKLLSTEEYHGTLNELYKKLEDIKSCILGNSEAHKINISNIIIDSNLHFCNLHPYINPVSESKEAFPEVNFYSHKKYIWYIWSLRDLYNLIREKNTSSAISSIINSADHIEKNIFNEVEDSPFIHVYNPVILVSEYKELLNINSFFNISSKFEKTKILDKFLGFRNFINKFEQFSGSFMDETKKNQPERLKRIIEEVLVKVATSDRDNPNAYYKNIIPLAYNKRLSDEINEKNDVLNFIYHLNLYESFDRIMKKRKLII